MLVPEGCLIIQALGFPRETGTHTCIPTRGVGYWSRSGIVKLDRQLQTPGARPAGEPWCTKRIRRDLAR
jgi:hypothetical protein